MKNVSRYALYVRKPSLGEFTNEEAITLYQTARKCAKHLAIVASGTESAVCLMLGCRFMPDEIHIFPLLNCDIDIFLQEVAKRVSFPYFICAPIKIYVNHSVTDYEKTRIKKLLRSLSSFQKEIVYVSNETETLRSLTNPDKTTKTLA